jgi:hypothetical protein
MLEKVSALSMFTAGISLLGEPFIVVLFGKYVDVFFLYYLDGCCFYHGFAVGVIFLLKISRMKDVVKIKATFLYDFVLCLWSPKFKIDSDCFNDKSCVCYFIFIKCCKLFVSKSTKTIFLFKYHFSF